MKIISVNVGQPREILWKGRVVTTAIFKEPVEGRVAVRRYNLDGDRQADLRVHGGPSKAVYVYPSEHYDYWRGELPGVNLPWGMFGENLTTEGLFEDQVSVGDRFRVGSAELMVTEPRLPCFKLAAKFGRDDMIKRFLASGRVGFYLTVVSEGELGVGEVVECISRDSHGVTVADVVRLHVDKRKDYQLMRRAVEVEALPESWREGFREQLEGVG
jgi:MOSC domain-containing protein YiiM